MAGFLRPPISPRRCALLIATGVWLVYLATAGGTLGSGDAVAMYEQTKSLLDRGALDVPPEHSHPNWQGLNGKYYLAFGVAQAGYNVPFVVAARVVAPIVGWREDPETLSKSFVALGATMPYAVAAAFTFLIAFRLSGHRRSAAVAALMLAFGTMVWPYSKYGFNAALATGAIAAGTYALAVGWLDRRRAMLMMGGLAFGVALLTRHEMGIAAAAGLVWLVLESRGVAHRWRWIATAAFGSVAAASLSAWLNWSHFGDPLETGHHPGFGLAGFVGLLFAPSGSLLLYSPVAIAALALVRFARENALARLVGGIIVAMMLFYMSTEDWLGTRSYGPRYLVPLLPLMTAPLAIWWSRPLTPVRRTAIATLCVVSLAVQVPAIPVDAARVAIAAGQPAAPARRADWSWCPLALNARAAAADVPANVRALLSGTRPAIEPAGNAPLGRRLRASLDFWWLYLYYLGVIPAWIALLAGALLVVSGSAILGIVWRRTRVDA